MVSRKRTRSELDSGASEEHQNQHQNQNHGQQIEESGLLQRLRNCWEFANLMQYIHFFGKVVKIDEDFDIEVCLRSMWGRIPRLQGFRFYCSPRRLLVSYLEGLLLTLDTLH